MVLADPLSCVSSSWRFHPGSVFVRHRSRARRVRAGMALDPPPRLADPLPWKSARPTTRGKCGRWPASSRAISRASPRLSGQQSWCALLVGLSSTAVSAPPRRSEEVHHPVTRFSGEAGRTAASQQHVSGAR